MNSYIENILKEEKKKQIKETIHKKNGFSKYCSEDIGTILYQDKLKSIEKYEKVANIFKFFGDNFDYNEDILSDLRKRVKEASCLEVVSIEEFGYDKNYLSELNKLSGHNGLYNIVYGVTDTGYVEVTNNHIVQKDLLTDYEFSIIKSDIKNKIVIYGNKPIRILSYKEANYINSIDFSNVKNLLLIGADLGYVGYLLKDKVNISISEEKELFDFLDEYIYKKMDLKITLENDLDFSKYDMILISPQFDSDMQLRLFNKLKLYKYKNVESYVTDLILSKYKSTLQDVIMTDKQQVIDALIESNYEMKGIGQEILSAQLDFVEKSEKYLDENKIYFDNYKKYQKFIRNDDIIYDILNINI